LHGPQFGHPDPNPPVCGHGLFVALTGTSLRVPAGMCAGEVAAMAAASFNATALFRESGLSASAHAVSSSAVTVSLAPQGTVAPQAEAVLIIAGVGASNLAVEAIGIEGLTVGEAVGSLPLPLVAPEPAPCAGDCDGGGSVTVDELVILVNIALGLQPVANCPPGNIDGNQAITVDEILMAVGNALSGCRN
jgi:hypothetical protein